MATGSSTDNERGAGAPPGPGLRLGLRFTLLIALLPLLALPWIGLRFVERMAEMTRDAQAENQHAAARSLAASLHERQELFGLGDPARLPRGIQPIVVQSLAGMKADDDAVDWSKAARLPVPVRIEGSAPPQTLDVRMAIARVGRVTAVAGARPADAPPGRLYLMVEADDERLVMPGDIDTSGGGPVVQPGDQLTVLVGGEAQLQQIVAADQLARSAGTFRTGLPDLPQRIPVPLTATGHGWRAQIALPDEARLVQVQVVDVDYLGSRRVEARADSGLLLVAPSGDVAERAAAERRDRQWTEVLRALDRGVGRISIVDPEGRLLASRGNLAQALPPAQDLPAHLARFLLALAMRIDTKDVSGTSDSMSALSSALTGVPGQTTERVGTQAGMPVWLLASAHPVWIGDRVAGALLLEDSTVARLSLAQRALERMTLLVAAALAVTACALLAVATLAVSRIVRLRRAAEAAIDPRGRVRGAVPRFRLRDEVDAMAESYNRLLGRLHEHQDYLARLRSRLVHELRTPIMVVRSSLDNLAAETSAEGAPAADTSAEGAPAAEPRGAPPPSPQTDPQRPWAYVQRAQAGAARLERIVASMGEAGSLEAMLEDSEMQTTDLVALVGSCVEGYRSAYPGLRLRVDAAVAAASCLVAPEAIAQALDKLVGNAADFARPESEIVVGIGPAKAGDPRVWRIAVANQGPALPLEMVDSLFEAMVSVREDVPGASDQRGHLGLGLYLVRLIAEFHGGKAWARNVNGGVEVGFTVKAAG